MKIKILMASLMAIHLGACVNPNTTSNSFEKPKNQIAMIENNKTELSTGASFSVTFDFSKSFQTKASANGTAPKLISDIANAKLYLITNNSDPMAAGSVKFTSGILAFSGAPQTYTFGNVPPGGPYFVAVELFDSSSNNIIEPFSFGGTTGTMGLTVSSGAVPSITVNAQNQVSSTNAITISPVLKSGIGATLDTTVAPTNGASTNGPITIN